MTSIDLDVPARALAIGAHPDDIEFGCGATLAKWGATGTSVHLLVLTDGSKGTWDPGADLTALVDERQREQRDAAAALGAASTENLGGIDGELDETVALRAEICARIRRIRPSVVLGHDPWKHYRLHPDHRHAGFLTLDALVAARDPHFFPDQDVAPFRPAALLLFEADAPDHVERVDGTIDRKVEALLAHRSQWRSTLGIEPSDPAPGTAAFVGRVRGEAIEAGASAGVPMAESFKLVSEL